jgi:3-deoxy-D-manno-octulosonate 8-phosphate phosphatase (KDO 8-P phosphatase)
VRRRVADLGIRHALFGIHDKLAAAEPLLAELGLDWSQIAAMGDDWPDLPLLTRAGLGIAPPGAHAEVKAVAGYITQAPAGYGAAREACDLLLMAAGQYGRLFEQHLKTLDGR